MRTIRALELNDCLAAVNAILAEWKTEPSNPPITIAIVDDSGNLVAFARSDGAGALLGRNCIKKAYTSAMTGASTKVFGERRPGERDYAAELQEHGWNVAEMGDPNLMIISGGICIRDPNSNAILGGIGVSGLPYGPGDHDLALVGLKALNL
jgi:uncharacterized protein GlcG (DUF336 family)